MRELKIIIQRATTTQTNNARKKAKIRRSLIPYIPRTCTGNTTNYVMRA
jgi:hypothetical protein